MKIFRRNSEEKVVIIESSYERHIRLDREEAQRRESECDAYTAKHLETIKSEVLFDDITRAQLVQQEHQSDLDNFRIFPKRHGDYLTLFITRQLREGDEGAEQFAGGEPAKLSVSINLHDTKRITLVNGRAAGAHGEAFFVYKVKTEYQDEAIKPHATTDCPAPRRMLGDGVLDDRIYSRWTKSYALYHKLGIERVLDETVKGLSAYAVSDLIVFDGAGTSIFVPFGLGQEVYDQIMVEIGQGYTPPAIRMIG